MVRKQQFPRNPGMDRNQKPKEKGKTKIANGVLQCWDTLAGEWRKAVRLEDIRERLLEEESPDLYGDFPLPVLTSLRDTKSSDYEKECGTDALDKTSFLAKDKRYGLARENRPAVLYQIYRPDGVRGVKPKKWLLDGGSIVLDTADHPIRDFPELPKCLSSAVGGHDINYYWRQNEFITTYDLLSRMPNGFHNKEANGAWHPGPVRYGTVGMRATRFRLQTGMLSWTKREGSDPKNDNILKILSQACKDADSTLTFRDLTRPEQVSIERIGSMPSRATAANREKKRKIQASTLEINNRKNGRFCKQKKDDDSEDSTGSMSDLGDDDDEEEEAWEISSTEEVITIDETTDSEDDSSKSRKGSSIPLKQSIKHRNLAPSPKAASKRMKITTILNPEVEPKSDSRVKTMVSKRKRISSYDGPMSESSSEAEDVEWLGREVKEIVRTEDFIFGPLMPRIKQRQDYRHAELTQRIGATEDDYDAVKKALSLAREDWHLHLGYHPQMSRYEDDSYLDRHRAMQMDFARAWKRSGKQGHAPELYWVRVEWKRGWQDWEIPDDRGRELYKKVLEEEEEDLDRSRKKARK